MSDVDDYGMIPSPEVADRSLETLGSDFNVWWNDFNVWLIFMRWTDIGNTVENGIYGVMQMRLMYGFNIRGSYGGVI